MNASEIYSPAPRKARVEIIPLIDVIFFLLATFVLFTLSLDKLASIGVTLPQSGRPSGEDTTALIQATDAGMFFWKEGRDAAPELISAREIPARLADYKARVAEPRVLVRGDGKARFGPAVFLLDEVRKAGIAEVSVETLVSSPGK
jgi:biopolymer transport protein ExbD